MGYLNRKLTLNSVAIEFKSNATYLSKVINFYKNKNFTTYINELRIDFAINRLQNDKQFQAYTIKAVAHDVGFNNSESFSTAFRKKTGLNPSYFIKKLQKRSK